MAHMAHYESDSERRYKPCQVLSGNQVACAIWFEDTLHHYGVPTILFDLYLLVQDIDEAAELLVKAGWVIDSQGPHTIGNAEVELPQKRLIFPSSQAITVLLPAQEWKFSLMADSASDGTSLTTEGTSLTTDDTSLTTDDTSLTTDDTPLTTESSPENVFFPPLPGFLDALIESWLDCPCDDGMLLIHLACQISYLYAYAPALKQRSFAERMKYEHRQFHFDVLAGMQIGTIPFRKHERAIRDALLQGQYELRECSMSCDNEEIP
ncbi:hypothetical protein LT330_005891 [Penicillium expansum]|nr:hypothetical protein LT330_005891 [Penicillium expansum]